MSRYPLLLETIRVEEGQIQHWEVHLDRMRRSCKALKIPLQPVDFDSIKALSCAHFKGVFKLRILYSVQIKEMTIEPYVVRPVDSLKIMVADHLEYDHKYADRGALNELFKQRGDADDVLLIKNGLLTDTSYANIALFDGRHWCTPAHPLLPGTHRQRLLETGILQPTDIRLEHLSQYQSLKLINAMMYLEESPEIPIHRIQ